MRQTPAPPDDRACFIHRDYHPGNTLWTGGRLTGVVDWIGGSWGPPSVDLGHMRVNLTAVATRLLAVAGVERVDPSGLCTSCNPELFYSHRRDGERTGRQAGFVWRIDGAAT